MGVTAQPANRTPPIIWALAWTSIFVLACGVMALRYPGTGEQRLMRVTMLLLEVEVVVAVLLVPGLMVVKHLRRRRERSAARQRDAIETLLAGNPSLEEVAAVASHWPGEFTRVLYRAFTLLQGTTKRSLAGLVRQAGCIPMLLRDAVSPNPNQAIRAIRILSEIHDADCRIAVEKALDHESPFVRATARRAVLAGGSCEARWRVFVNAPSAPIWERILLYESASTAPALVDDLLGRAFSSKNDRLMLCALEMAAGLQRLTGCPVPQSLAASQSTEIRIKFYKALPFLRPTGTPRDILRAGLRDADWRVRAMAAQACARLQETSLTSDLLRLCRDFEHPAEAAHAGRALAGFGGEAMLRLEALAATGPVAASRVATEIVGDQWSKGLIKR